MTVIRVSFGAIWAFNVFIPFAGVLFSIIWSILFDFKAAVNTPCRVAEVLPSVSHASGDFTPQRFVWRICITVHNGLRFVLAFTYYNWHMRIEVRRWRIVYNILVKMAFTVHLIEIIALTVLTSIALEENGNVHEKAFITFVVTSQVYMFLSCLLISWSHRTAPHLVLRKDIKIFRFKKALFVFNVIMFGLAVKLFFKHEKHCQPYGHSMFAFCEYLTVFSNMAFHVLASVDFKNYTITYLATEDVTSGVFRNK